jgi:RND family efflux transporter MFP subunit
MWNRLRGLLQTPRWRWLGPVSGTLLVALILAPELIGRDSSRPPEVAPAQMHPIPDLPKAAAFDAEVPSVHPAVADPAPTFDPLVGMDVDLDLSSKFDCVIEPAEIVDLGSPVTGVIDVIHVERGDFVQAGEAVAELESTVERAAAELARARSQLEGAIKSREASYALGQRREERIDRLFKGDTLSLDLRDQAETEAEIAELELLEAVEHRRLARLELQRALAVLERRTIRSPISGVVMSREMAGGEVVVDEKTILTIAQIDPLRVEVILPAALYGGVQKGIRAAVEPEFGGQVLIASVKIVDRVIDAASGTFGVQLELPNPDHAIPGGLNCQVSFLGP